MCSRALAPLAQSSQLVSSFGEWLMPATLAQLREALRALPPGAPVTLQVQREGRLMYVSFTFD